MTTNHFICYVNSRYRTSGTTSDFLFTIDMPDGNTGAIFDSICVLQAAIPKSYYLIDEGRNNFTLREIVAGEPVNILISIVPGNYTRRSLAYTLNDLLNSQSLEHGNGHTYTVLVPDTARGPDTGKYKFTVNTLVPEVQPRIVFGSTSSPADQMGFLQNTEYFFSNGVLESVQVCNLQLDESVYIMCHNVVNGTSTILQEIYSATPDFGMMMFEVGAAGGIMANKKKLQKNLGNFFQFQILNSDLEKLNLNGINLSFSLLIWDSKRYDPGGPETN